MSHDQPDVAAPPPFIPDNASRHGSEQQRPCCRLKADLLAGLEAAVATLDGIRAGQTYPALQYIEQLHRLKALAATAREQVRS